MYVCMYVCSIQLLMPKIPYVEFASGFEYFYLTWLKYELAFSALDYANEVFYLDAGIQVYMRRVSMYLVHVYMNMYVCMYTV